MEPADFPRDNDDTVNITADKDAKDATEHGRDAIASQLHTLEQVSFIPTLRHKQCADCDCRVWKVQKREGVRTRVGTGKRVSVRVDLGGRRIMKTTKSKNLKG